MTNSSSFAKMRVWAVRLTQWLVGKRDLTECGNPAERSCQGRILACSVAEDVSAAATTAMQICLGWTLERGREHEKGLPELIEFGVHAATSEAHLRSLLPTRLERALRSLAEDGDTDVKAPADEIRALVRNAKDAFLPSMGAIQQFLKKQGPNIRKGVKPAPQIEKEVDSLLTAGAAACSRAVYTLSAVTPAATRLSKAALAA